MGVAALGGGIEIRKLGGHNSSKIALHLIHCAYWCLLVVWPQVTNKC